jgi:tetratricopeptide (TPR) repeat protein
VDGERGNLIPVVAYATEHGHQVAACQLTYLLTAFYDRRGHWGDRVTLCQWGVRAALALDDPAMESLMRSTLGVAYIAARRFEDALEILREALTLTQRSGDTHGEGHVHNNMAVAYGRLRRFDEAAESFDRALATHAPTDLAAMALALNNIGYAKVLSGTGGLTQLSKALELARQIGDVRLEAAILHGMGMAYRNERDYDRALRHLRGSLATFRRVADQRDLPVVLDAIGAVHVQQGDHTSAIEHFTEARALSRDLADKHTEAIVLGHLGEAHLRSSDLPSARQHLTMTLDLRKRIPDSFEEATLRAWLAEVDSAILSD